MCGIFTPPTMMTLHAAGQHGAFPRATLPIGIFSDLGKKADNNGPVLRSSSLIAVTMTIILSGPSLLAAKGVDGGAAPPASTSQPEGSPGFRLEGQPALEIPFGDADAYRKIVDRFLSLDDQ